MSARRIAAAAVVMVAFVCTSPRASAARAGTRAGCDVTSDAAGMDGASAVAGLALTTLLVLGRRRD